METATKTSRQLGRSPTRRIIFWLLLFVFVVSAVWWCFFLPYSRDSVYRAVPVNFRYLSRHEKLGDRWQEILTHPVTLALAEGAGGTARELRAWADDPGVDALIRALAGRETVAAYVPFLGPTGQPAWLLSSWVGGRGRLFDRALLKETAPGLSRVEIGGGQEIWTAKLEKSSMGAYLSMTIVEGVLLACVNDDSEAVVYLVDRLERRMPIVGQLRELPERELAGDGAVPDRGWIRWISSTGTVPKMHELAFGFTETSGRKLCGWVRGAQSMPRPRLSQIQGVDGLPGPLPVASVLLPAGGVVPWLQKQGYPETVTELLGRANEQVAPESPFFLSMYGGEYSGRIFGFRAPTIACGWQVHKPEEVPDLVTGILDRLSAEYGWTIIPRSVPAEDYVLIALDGTEAGVYSALKKGENSALAIKGNWVVLGSNMQALMRLMDETVGVEFAAACSQVLNRPDAPRADDASVYSSIELAPASTAVRNAVAVYSLMLLGSGDVDSAKRRATLSEFGDFLKIAGGLGKCLVWLGNEGDGFKAHFELGHGEP